jgi:peptide subunit release factor 1 (eRF1)
MISLVIPPKDQVSRIVKMLADEYGTASNIKSRVNRCVFESNLIDRKCFVCHDESNSPIC